MLHCFDAHIHLLKYGMETNKKKIVFFILPILVFFVKNPTGIICNRTTTYLCSYVVECILWFRFFTIVNVQNHINSTASYTYTQYSYYLFQRSTIQIVHCIFFFSLFHRSLCLLVFGLFLHIFKFSLSKKIKYSPIRNPPFSCYKFFVT